jgi:hypothetical protein
LTGKLIQEYDELQKEVLCLKVITFNNENYIITSSTDGTILERLISLEENFKLLFNFKLNFNNDSEHTNPIHTFSFLPNCGNSFMLLSYQKYLYLLNFETNQVKFS